MIASLPARPSSNNTHDDNQFSSNLKIAESRQITETVVVELDPGVIAPSDQIPLNRGPMPEQPSPVDNEEEWGQGDIVPTRGENWVEDDDEGGTKESEDDDLLDNEDDELPSDNIIPNTKAAVCESFAKLLSAVGYGLVRVAYNPNAEWQDSVGDGEMRNWPESRGNMFEFELLGNTDNSLDIGKGCIKEQLLEQLEEKIMRLRKACAAVRSIKAELSIEREEFVRVAVADGQERFSAVQYGAVVSAESPLVDSELAAIKDDLVQHKTNDLHPAVVNIVTGKTTIHRIQPSPANNSPLHWEVYA